MTSQSVYNPSIVDLVVTNAGEPRHLQIHFETINPDDSCCEINFDYQSTSVVEIFGPASRCSILFPGSASPSNPITNPMNVTHTYVTKDTYYVKVHCKDMMEGSTSVIKVITVSGANCVSPVCKINKKYAATCATPLVREASDRFVLTGTFEYSCNSRANIKAWKVEEIDPAYCNTTYTLSFLSGTDDKLVIQRRHLEKMTVGATYKFTYT